MLTAKYEKLGIPTVNIVSTSVESVAKKRATSATEAMPALRMISIPNVSQEAKNALALATVPKIVEALTKPLTEQEKYKGKFELPKEPRIAFTGTLDEVQDFFIGDLSKYVTTAPHAEYTDGLPVMPPTQDRVAKMLKGTKHKADEVIGQLAPLNGIATVEKVAINAVMAGARPEYMPVLLALTEAMTKDGGAQNSAQGGSGIFSYSIVINGPVAKELGINSGGPQLSGPAPLSPGVPANMVIGRFMRLMQVNVAGIEPGVTEAKGIGSPRKTSLVIAEANDESPWPQLSSDPGIGFKDKENTLTLVSGWSDSLTGFGPTLKDFGTTKAQISNPDVLARYLTCVADSAPALARPAMGLLYFMSPALAREIAKAGYTKRDVQKWIYENTVAPWGKVKRQPWITFTMFEPAESLSVQGKPMPLYVRANYAPNMPDDTPVKYFAAPEAITVVVGPGTPLPQVWSMIMNAHPRWTTAIDKWR
ncbi:MAG: hypothetical protein M0009_17205 [Deltaproteobacteria bacterium]|nr:hypothetical protein [Deltaproteobacteria bacterium]